MSQYAYNPEVRSGVAVGGVVSYDDEQAICDKTDYAMKHNLNGFIIWEVSGEDARQVREMRWFVMMAFSISYTFIQAI